MLSQYKSVSYKYYICLCDTLWYNRQLKSQNIIIQSNKYNYYVLKYCIKNYVIYLNLYIYIYIYIYYTISTNKKK